MESHEVAPDCVDQCPTVLLEVSYPSGVKAECGNVVTPTQVKDQPQVKWTPEPDSWYTLAMVDPDAPSRKEPKFRLWEHWLVGNIPGNDISQGEILFDYVGSGPPQGTGLHRYVFLLYKQSGKINFKENKIPKTSTAGRPKFSIKEFAKSYDLGNPVAGNLFQAEYDDYCPLLYKQFTD